MDKLKIKNRYLLGIRKEDNKRVYLIEPTWNCNWYWGFGYIQTFITRAIYDHQHFNSLFLEQEIFDSYKNYFIDLTLNDDEIWQLLGYMKEYYTMEKYAEFLQYGNHITSKAKNVLEEKNKVENDKEVYRINKILMPELFAKIDKLLTENNEK